MSRLEGVTVGSTVQGITGNDSISIVSTQYHGSSIVEMTYNSSQNVLGAQILDNEEGTNVNIKLDVFGGRKNLATVKSELEGKVLSLGDIDDYMLKAGYESILPADIDNINNTGLIWYPFEPFLNQINIWVECDGENYMIKADEHFSDCDNKDGAN